MRASLGGRDELVLRVQQRIALATKKEAQITVEAVISALEETLLNNLASDGFTLKLGSFGKFSVRHKSGIRRKVGFSGQTVLTKPLRKVKFISLGPLRQQERIG
jgi:nucleoid DNA-binding protein